MRGSPRTVFRDSAQSTTNSYKTETNMPIKKKGEGSGKKAPPKEVSAEEIESNLAGIAQAGLAMAVADGEIEEEELTVIAQVMHAILTDLGVEITGEQFGSTIEELVNEFAGKSFEDVLKLVSSKVTNPKIAKVAVGVASLVLSSDGEYDEEVEGPVFYGLAQALGFDQEAADAIYYEYVGELAARDRPKLDQTLSWRSTMNRVSCNALDVPRATIASRSYALAAPTRFAAQVGLSSAMCGY